MHLSLDENDVTSTDPRRLQMVRAAAYFLLHAIGDRQDETVTETARVGDMEHTITRTAPPKPPVPNTATAPATVSSVAPAAVNVPPPPTIVPAAIAFNPPPPPPPPNSSPQTADYDDDETDDSNVVNFPTAGTVPPPPPANTAATLAPSGNVAPIVVAATNVVSANAGVPTHFELPVPVPPGSQPPTVVEYDSVGMPWDARIHQKAKGKKKDNTWKLIKGIDPAIVQAVTAELAARKGASAPVSLPLAPNFAPGTQAPGPILGTNSVPVPPVSNVPAPPGVPAPPAPASVSVPPPPAVGAVSASPYRALIDKITEFTKAGKLAPAKVAEICQSHGAPSLMALNGMQTQMSVRDPGLTVVQGVDKDVDAAALGLL